MKKKESTPEREAKRRYEQRNKEQRKATSSLFGTMMPKAEVEEMNEFIAKYDISKVFLIRVGYEVVKKIIEEQEVKS